MSDIRTPGDAGQYPDLSAPINTAGVLAQLRTLEREIEQSLPRIHAIADRLEAIIGTTEAEPPSNPRSAENNVAEATRGQTPDAEGGMPHVPALALRSDGKALLSIAYVRDADLSARERWEGVVLTGAEAFDALNRVSDACDDAAGHVGGGIVWKDKPRNDEDGDE